jgi:uncharacterized protein
VPGSLTYLDSSALVKLVVREAETLPLRAFLQDHPFRVSSRIAQVEVIRAVARARPSAISAAQALLRRIALIEMEAGVLDAAARVRPAELRTLDAIHVASAVSLADELDVAVVYDARLASALTSEGIEVVWPS